ncbi:MAG: M1 family aminopeptidase [Chloroflexota bacterium]
MTTVLILLALLSASATPTTTIDAASLISASSPAAAAGPAPAASYRLDISVSLSAGTAEVVQSVRVRNVVGVPLESLVFRIPANVDGLFALAAASVNGGPVQASLDGSMLELPLGRSLAHGESVQADLRFSLTMPETPGRLAKSGRSIALGYWFPLLAVHRGEWDRRQFVDVGDATFSEVADFDLTVTTSAPAKVVATGRRVEQDGVRSRFVAASVRDVAVAISPDYIVRSQMVGDSLLEVATFDETRADFYLSRGTEFLRWANGKFGPYPYPVLVIADTDLPSSYGGLEYPGLIFLARGIGLPVHQPDGSSLDTLYLHEILHQWFYSLVGNDQIADPWLDEAMVTYMTYSYYREERPALASGVYGRTIAGSAPGFIDGSVYDFPADPPYFSVVYRRGARFLEALHDQLGNDAFWTLIREYVDTNRDRVASPRAFLDRAQAASAASLGPLVRQYTAYGAFQDTERPVWNVDAPAGPWSGTVPLFVAAEFPVTRVEVWLDARKLADGPANALTLDLADVEPGEYVLLVRVYDHRDVRFERARRVTVTP